MPALRKLGIWTFTFSRKRNPFGCQTLDDAEEGDRGKGVSPPWLNAPPQNLALVWVGPGKRRVETPLPWSGVVGGDGVCFPLRALVWTSFLCTPGPWPGAPEPFLSPRLPPSESWAPGSSADAPGDTCLPSSLSSLWSWAVGGGRLALAGGRVSQLSFPRRGQVQSLSCCGPGAGGVLRSGVMSKQSLRSGVGVEVGADNKQDNSRLGGAVKKRKLVVFGGVVMLPRRGWSGRASQVSQTEGTSGAKTWGWGDCAWSQ